MEQLTTNPAEQETASTRRWPRAVGLTAITAAALTVAGVGVHQVFDRHSDRCGVEMTNPASTYRIFGVDWAQASFGADSLNIDGDNFSLADIPAQHLLEEDLMLTIDPDVDSETGELVSVSLTCQET